jgi:hypothetical protein
VDNGRERPGSADGIALVTARVAALERWRERHVDPHIELVERKEGRRDGRRELWADISKIIAALVTIAGGIIAVLAFAGLGY